MGNPLTRHGGAVRAVSFGELTGGRSVLATASDDGMVLLCDLAQPTSTGVAGAFRIAPSIPLSLHLAGTALFIGCSDGIVVLNLPNRHRLEV